jgi:hypothetical protein
MYLLVNSQDQSRQVPAALQSENFHALSSRSSTARIAVGIVAFPASRPFDASTHEYTMDMDGRRVFHVEDLQFSLVHTHYLAQSTHINSFAVRQ